MPGASSAISSPLCAVGRELDHVPIVLQQALEQAPQARIVFDDEQVHVGQPSNSSGATGRP